MKKQLLVAMAHADDMETYAGGTVAKFIAKGYEVVLIMMTNNMCGADIDRDDNFLNHSPQEVMRVREEEARLGAESLGVDTIVQMDFKDSMYFDGEQLVALGDEGYDIHHPAGQEPLAAVPANKRCIERVRKVLEQYEPEIVITHNFSSGFEHSCVAHVVNQAFGQAVRDGAKFGSLWVPTHVRPGAWETDVRMFPSPNVLIDVTDHWASKLRALRVHKSQQVEKRVKKLDIIAQYWGLARQCRYAEPFFTIQDGRYR